VHGLVAAVAEHLAVRIVRALANKAWLPDFHGEELVLHDHGWVNLSLLHLVLDGIAVNDGATDCLAELDGVEFGATYGTAVRALDPRLEACVVQVVSAGQKMGYDFLIVVDTFGGEGGVAQQALGEQLLVAVVVTSSSSMSVSVSVSMRARFSWQIGLGRSSNGFEGGELVSQIAQTDYALFRHAEATSSDLARALGVRV